MTFSSSLSDDGQAKIVTDTSILINLECCGIGKEIVQLIDNPFVVTEGVADEVGGKQGKFYESSRIFMEGLLSANLLEVVRLSDEEIEVSQRMTRMENGLEEGEATTIAVAKSRGYIPIIDEKRGRAYALNELGNVIIGRSIDVLLHSKVRSTIAGSLIREAVYFALRDAKMNISPNQLNFVIELIGKDRARACVSLPGYKKLKEEWDTQKA